MSERGHKGCAIIIVLFIVIALLPAAFATEATISPTIKGKASPTPMVTGIISGAVYDMNGQGIPDAKVTLYVAARLNNRYVNKLPASVADNPQLTTANGLFVFEDVPKGTYNITVEKNGKLAYKIINVTAGTVSAEIFMKDYVALPSPAIEPSILPSLSPSPSSTPTPALSVKPSVRPTPTPYTPDLSKILFETARLALMAVIGAQFIAGAGIFLYMKKLKRI